MINRKSATPAAYRKDQNSSKNVKRYVNYRAGSNSGFVRKIILNKKTNEWILKHKRELKICRHRVKKKITVFRLTIK